MTKRDVNKDFQENVLPFIVAKYGNTDIVAKRTAWNDHVDLLEKEGKVTYRQACNWLNPYN